MKNRFLFSLICTLCIIHCIPGFLRITVNAASSGQCGENVTWTLDDNGTLTVSGTGPMNNYDIHGAVPWCAYYSSIKEIIISEGVTTIGNTAFEFCSKAECVTIANSVTYIGEYAFAQCSNLKSIDISDNAINIGSYAFYDCDELLYITIPDNVTNLGNYVFKDCDKLVGVTIL